MWPEPSDGNNASHLEGIKEISCLVIGFVSVSLKGGEMLKRLYFSPFSSDELCNSLFYSSSQIFGGCISDFSKVVHF